MQTIEDLAASRISSTYENLTVINLFFEQNKINILKLDSTNETDDRLEDFSNGMHNALNTFYNLDKIANNSRIHEKRSITHPFRAYVSWWLGNRKKYLYETIENKKLDGKLKEIEKLASQMKESLGTGIFFESVDKFVNSNKSYPLYTTMLDTYLHIVGNLPSFVSIKYDLKFRKEPT